MAVNVLVDQTVRRVWSEEEKSPFLFKELFLMCIESGNFAFKIKICI